MKEQVLNEGKKERKNGQPEVSAGTFFKDFSFRSLFYPSLSFPVFLSIPVSEGRRRAEYIPRKSKKERGKQGIMETCRQKEGD